MDGFDPHTVNISVFTTDKIKSAMIVENCVVNIVNTNITNFFTTDSGAAVSAINSNVYVTGSYF
jgi:hypothetical protein